MYRTIVSSLMRARRGRGGVYVWAGDAPGLLTTAQGNHVRDSRGQEKSEVGAGSIFSVGYA